MEHIWNIGIGFVVGAIVGFWLVGVDPTNPWFLGAVATGGVVGLVGSLVDNR